MEYIIPAGTPCKIAPDDDLTPYLPYRAKKDAVGILRFPLDSGWLLLIVGDQCVQVEEKLVTKV